MPGVTHKLYPSSRNEPPRLRRSCRKSSRSTQGRIPASRLAVSPHRIPQFNPLKPKSYYMKLNQNQLTTNAAHVSTRLNPGLLAVVVLAISSVCSQAVTANWLSSSGDSYTNKAAWSTSLLPGSADTAVIGNTTQPNGVCVYTNAAPDPAATNSLTALQLASTAGTSSLTLSSGTLSITNTGAGILLGNAVNVQLRSQWLNLRFHGCKQQTPSDIQNEQSCV
jgi:hypothetical protein